jgi:hypothetical protein
MPVERKRLRPVGGLEGPGYRFSQPAAGKQLKVADLDLGPAFRQPKPTR